MIFKNLSAICFLSIIFLSCNDSQLCRNEIIASRDNPARTLKLIKFDRDCGATTGNSVQISVLKFQESLQNLGGNIFISKNYDKDIDMAWENDSTILIQYPKKLVIIKREDQYDNLKVKYQDK
jgi:hypothetical protein